MAFGGVPGSPDAQSLVAMLNGLDAESAVAAISQVLTAKPELAPAIVSFAVPDLTYAPSRAFTERRARGTVKQYSKHSGFGFIECPELHAVFGKDVFVHARQLSSFDVGAEVTFAVVLNKDNKPQAVDLLTLDGKGCDGKVAGKGIADVGKGKIDVWGKGKSDGLGKGLWDGGKGKGDDWGKGGNVGKGLKPSTAKPDEQAALGQFAGVIKSFDHKNGYGFGFIQSDGMKAMGYTNDVYLHHLQLNGCEVTQEVSFVAYLNRKGQPQAKDVAPLGPPPSSQHFGIPVAASVPAHDQQGWSVLPSTQPAPVSLPFGTQMASVPVAPHVPVRAEFIDPLAQYHEQPEAAEGYVAEASDTYGDGLSGQQAGYGSAAARLLQQVQQSDQMQWSSAASQSADLLGQQLDQTQWSPQTMEPFALGHPFAAEDPEAKRQRLEQQGW